MQILDGISRSSCMIFHYHSHFFYYLFFNLNYSEHHLRDALKLEEKLTSFGNYLFIYFLLKNTFCMGFLSLKLFLVLLSYSYDSYAITMIILIFVKKGYIYFFIDAG